VQNLVFPNSASLNSSESNSTSPQLLQAEAPGN
jgi:hypothetical protein